MPNIWRKLAVTIVMAVVVTLMHGALYHVKIRLTTIPFTLMGLALAIFLGFRNSASYERYWEGRRLWGSLGTASRNLLRQLYAYPQVSSSACPQERAQLAQLQKNMAYATIAFAHALRHQLREESWGEEIARLLPAERVLGWQRLQHRAAAILQAIGNDIGRALASGWLAAPLAQEIDRSLSQMSDALGGCERIKNTPIPFSYSVLLHRTVYVYCYLLPFGLVDSIGLLTPVVVGVVAYTFFGLDAIGDEIEEPFGFTPNDLPLTALSYGIESSAREMMGETEIPAMPPPVDYCLQ